MQAIIITRNDILSETVTLDMLREICVKYLEMSNEAVDQTAAQKLNKPSKTMANLSYAKLRTIVDKKLHDSPDDIYGELYRTGQLELEFDCLPDLDIGNAGKNTKRERKSADGKTSAPRSKFSGTYTIVKRHDAKNDPAKDTALRQHIWTSATVEEYMSKADAKYVSATGRVISARDEINWAFKSGWIKPVAA